MHLLDMLDVGIEMRYVGVLKTPNQGHMVQCCSVA